MINRKNSYLLIMLSLAFTSFISRLDYYIVNISLPAISQYFRVGTGTISWLLLSFSLTTASTLIIAGRIGDRYGLKKFLLIGYLLFALTSLGCGLAPNFLTLLCLRVLQGLGAAILLTITGSMVIHCLPLNIRGIGISYLSMANALGVCVGFPLGGIISGLSSWRWIFLITVPLGIIAGIICWRILPADDKSCRKTNFLHFDWQGSVLILLTISSLILTLNMGQELGWLSLPIISIFLLGIIFLFIFVRREGRVASPLLDLHFFRRHPSFFIGAVGGSIGLMILIGIHFILPFYLINYRGFSPQLSGMLLMVQPCLYAIILYLIKGIISKFNNYYSIGFTFLCLAGSSWYFALNLSNPGVAWIYIYLAWLAVSLLGLFVPSYKLAFSTIPRGQEGLAVGLYQTIYAIGLALGVCVFETIFSHSLPPQFLTKALTHLAGKVSPQALLQAFFHSFIFAAILSLLGFVFLVWGACKSKTINTELPSK